MGGITISNIVVDPVIPKTLVPVNVYFVVTIGETVIVVVVAPVFHK